MMNECIHSPSPGHEKGAGIPRLPENTCTVIFSHFFINCAPAFHALPTCSPEI